MADSGTITYTGSDYAKRTNQNRLKKLVMNWTSDASAGTVEGTTTEKFSGRLRQAQFITGGTAPTDLYDVTVKDDQGQDILMGAGANIAIATGKTATEPSGVPMGYVLNSTLLLQISNAGNSKTGKVILFFE